MYGDYEAQRHWQEIAVNLPSNQWYRSSENNDLLYWGLDYPPLTAYHSWVIGKIALALNESWVELHSSRGTESYEHKLFMRYSVLVSDLLVYIPSAIFYAYGSSGKISWPVLTALLFYPGLTLIDYGHFQYNSVSLGFFILAVALLDKDMVYYGAASFCLALNYKQMELYHATPFFFYILGSCLQNTSLLDKFLALMNVGCAVLMTFGICWIPFFTSEDDVKAVIQRLFPFSRGLFEDKVSNFWCSMNVVFKIKNLIPQPIIVSLCAVATLLSIVPSSIKLVLQPTMKNFKYSLVISSLGFFLFSYQVHEKTILVPLISSLLLIDLEPFVVIWFSLVSIFSMLPLLIKDGLFIATIATTIPFISAMLIVYGEHFKEFRRQLLFGLSTGGVVTLTICSTFCTAPERFPDLWPVLVSLYSCLHFMFYFGYFNYVLLVTCSQQPAKSKQNWRHQPVKLD